MDEHSITGKFVAFVNSMRPCNRAMIAIEDNMKATAELRESVVKLDSTIEQLLPALDRIARAIVDEEPNV